MSVDDAGARHQAKNGFCTQIGDDRFTVFRTTGSKSRRFEKPAVRKAGGSKSRLNFLGLLRAGHTDFVLNDIAFAAGCMDGPGVSGGQTATIPILCQTE